MISSEDVLQPLSDEKLYKFLNVIHKSLPRAIVAHHYVFNYLKWVKQWQIRPDLKENLGDRCSATFYCHRNGALTNCTFVTLSGKKDYWIYLFSLEESGAELIDCIERTTKIEWKKRPIYVCVSNEHYDVVKKVLDKKNTNWYIFTPEKICGISREDVRKFDVNVPDHLTLQALQPKDATVINNSWPHKYEGSYNYILSNVLLNGGLGLYNRSDNKLIAWAVINEFYCPGFLHCIDQERRKGYGSLVFKALCKKIVEEDNLDVYTIFLYDNSASRGLFIDRLGFKIINTLRWIEITTLD